MKRIWIAFSGLGLLLLAYSIYAYSQVSGFQLLESNSHWGYIFAVSYQYAFVLALVVLLPNLFLALRWLLRKRKGKSVD